MSITEFLEKRRVNTDFHSHVCMGSIHGKFNISKGDMENFYELYAGNSQSLGLAEKPETYLPLLVDIDIKFNDISVVKRLYTDYHVECIVRDYQEVLKNILKDCKPENLICFVLEKNPYISKGFLKSGFHLHFPYTFLCKKDHENHLIPRVKKLLDKSRIFQNIGIEKAGDVIDSCYTKNPWLMYGSSKGENYEPYKLTYIIDSERENITLGEALKNYKIYDSDENEIKMDPKNLEYYLPRILSIKPWHRQDYIKEVKENLPSLIKIVKVEKEKKEYKNESKNLSEELIDSKKYLQLMSDSRASVYWDWMQIGWALYSISNGSEEGLKLWLEFSARCPEKFDEDDCISRWEKMEKRNMTIGTLKHFAKEDNPIEYNKICKPKNFIEKYGRDLSMDDVELFIKKDYIGYSQLFYEFYAKDNILGKDKTGKAVYVWNPTESLYVEQDIKYIKETVGIFFHDLKTDLMIVLANHYRGKDDDLSRAEQQQKMKILLSWKSSPGTLKGIIELIQEKVVVKNLEDIMDNITNVLPIKGGLKIDLKTLTIEPRTNKDLYSFELNRSFIDNFQKSKKFDKVVEFVKDIMNNENEQYELLHTLLGYCMTGETREQVFQIWIGSGSNGKSTMDNLVSKCLGRLHTGANVNIFLKSNKNNSHQSEMIPLLKAHVASFSEPDSEAKFDQETIKRFTSGGKDKISCRQLYEKSDNGYIPKCKLVCLCNDVPNFNLSDKAFLDRIKVIDFKRRFEKTKENMDKVEDIENNHLDEFFTWLCIGANNYYTNKAFPQSHSSLNKFEEIKEENDHVGEFLNNYTVEEEKDKLSWVKPEQLYAFFNSIETYKGKYIYKEFNKIMESKGYKRIQPNEKDESGKRPKVWSKLKIKSDF